MPSNYYTGPVANPYGAGFINPGGMPPKPEVTTATAAPAASGGGMSGAGVSAFGAIVGAVTNAYVSYTQGKMQSDTMVFNSKLKDIQARMIQFTAKINADRFREKAKSYVSGQRARYAKAGVKMEGSPIEVTIDTASNFEYDAKMMELNANMEAGNKNMESASMKSQASSYRESGLREAGSTLLTGTMDAANTLYSPKGR